MPRLGLADLEARFRRLSLVMYDTKVPIATLEKEVYPYLARGIEFVIHGGACAGFRDVPGRPPGFRVGVRFDLDVSS